MGELAQCIQRTFLANLFSSASRPCLERFAGTLTAGASCIDPSSDVKLTKTFGAGFKGSGSGSGTPWYFFWRLGGGSRVAIVLGQNQRVSPIVLSRSLHSCSITWGSEIDRPGRRVFIRGLLTRPALDLDHHHVRPSLRALLCTLYHSRVYWTTGLRLLRHSTLPWGRL